MEQPAPKPLYKSMPPIPPPPPELAQKRAAYGILVTEELKLALMDNNFGEQDNSHLYAPTTIVYAVSGALDFNLLVFDVHRMHNCQPCAIYALNKMSTTAGKWYIKDLRYPSLEGDEDTNMLRFEEATGGMKPEWHPWF